MIGRGRLGGVMIWELGSGYRGSQPSGQRDPLFQAIKQALETPRLTGIRRTGAGAEIAFTTSPLALYLVEWRTNLTAGNWNTLTNNISGDGGIIEVVDPMAGSEPLRFYRIGTPP